MLKLQRLRYAADNGHLPVITQKRLNYPRQRQRTEEKRPEKEYRPSQDRDNPYETDYQFSYEQNHSLPGVEKGELIIFLESQWYEAQYSQIRQDRVGLTLQHILLI